MKLKSLIVGIALLFLFGVSVNLAKASINSSCVADIDKNGFVGLSDYSILVSNFLKSSLLNPLADITRDGKVDLQDYSQLVANFLKPANCPTPTPNPNASKQENLEEAVTWNQDCALFSDNYPSTTCPTNFVADDNTIKTSGQYSIKLTGNRQQRQKITQSITVKPNTHYKISATIKIANRHVYSYLDLNYPITYTQQRSGVTDLIDQNKGIWGGNFEFAINNTRINSKGINDFEYRSASDIDWFTESSIVKTTATQGSIPVSFMLTGFDGSLYVDNITVEEVGGIIDNQYFHVPITKEFQGMKIVSVTQNPWVITTNAARFELTDNSIIEQKDNGTVGTIQFDTPLLANLTRQTTNEAGLVNLENNSVLISIGADSVVLVTVKTAAKVSVSGPKPSYSDFEGGTIFSTDSTKGILFSPIRSKAEIAAMPYSVLPQDYSRVYSDSELATKGYKFWNVIRDFTQTSWLVEYSLPQGGGFVSQVFPPKSFDVVDYCKNDAAVISVNINTAPGAIQSYNTQKFGRNHNIDIVWMYNYVTDNTQNPVEEYCKDSNQLIVSCTSPSAVTHIPVGGKMDVAGPLKIQEKAALTTLIAEAHSKNQKVIAYFSPQFYYTTNVDTFLANVQLFLDTYAFDGVYFDGLYDGDSLRSLELVRKTRNLLGDKFYLQHASWTNGLISRTFRFRTPYEDAYADLIWNGEYIKNTTDETWKYNYCGQNVSNTPSTLLAEVRPVDYSKPRAESLALTLSPQAQYDKTLACMGTFRIFPYTEDSFIVDNYLQSTTKFYPEDYVQKRTQMCLPHTCGDAQCDTLESITTCPQDCAPISATNSVTRSANTYTCGNNSSVAQWVVDGQPFYALHYTFDGNFAYDVSGNKVDADRELGTRYTPPQFSVVDNHHVATFNTSSNMFGLLGSAHRKLSFPNHTISSFMRLKQNATHDVHEYLLRLNSVSAAQGIVTGIYNNKYQVSLRSSAGQYQIFTANAALSPDWHTVGFTFDGATLRLYVDGVADTSATVTMENFSEMVNFFVGVSLNQPAAGFNGALDDLMITEQVLTPQQALEYHQSLLSTATFGSNQQVECITEENGKYSTAQKQ